MLWLEWLFSEPEKHTFLHLLNAGVQDVWTCNLSFYVSAGDPKSAFPTEPFPQAPGSDFLWLNLNPPSSTFYQSVFLEMCILIKDLQCRGHRVDSHPSVLHMRMWMSQVPVLMVIIIHPFKQYFVWPAGDMNLVTWIYQLTESIRNSFKPSLPIPWVKNLYILRTIIYLTLSLL